MKYTIYISNHCTDCSELINELESKDFEFSVLNVSSNPNLNRTIFITPALCDEHSVLAYGKADVLSKIDKVIL